MGKKAFTLTELLVVVVIIGTLSAIVLPKFTKVLETRRTTEAEQMMTAIRNEQEARCTLDKSYTLDESKLVSWPKDLGSNYTYTLGAEGISAKRIDKDYSLQMLTYFDGGICCSGDYCSQLNRSYPSCDTYQAKANKKCTATDLPTPPEIEEPVPEKQECPQNPPASTETRDGDCTTLTTYYLEEFPSCWQPQTTTSCSECPVPCPGGFTNDYCTCIECDSSKNMRLNASGTACECAIDEQYCASKGKVYWDNARETEGFSRGMPECGCRPCSEYYDESNMKPLIGPSTDGTKEGCSKPVCETTPDQCRDQGGQVLYVPENHPEDCYCKPCESFGKEYYGKSSTGELSGCEQEGCKLSPEICGAEGKVFQEGPEDHPSSCSCRSCSSFSSSWISYSGTSSTGYLSGCENTAHQCPLDYSDCGKQGKVLSIDYYNPENCSCKPCSSFGEEYSGTSSNGQLSGCERAECKLTESICAAERKVLYVPNFRPHTCSCRSCEELGMATKSSVDGSIVGSCEGKCERKLRECIAEGKIFEWPSPSEACVCKPCDAYTGYAGTTPTGHKEDCRNCPK